MLRTGLFRRQHQSRPRDRFLSALFGRWTRAIYLTISVLLLANYFLIFRFAFFPALPRELFPDRSFHPYPLLPNAHVPSRQGHKANSTDYRTWKTSTQFKTHSNTTADEDEDDLCAPFPAYLLSKIQVVLKVGAADHWTRTSSQVNAIIKCIPNALILSDRDHPYGIEGHFNATDIIASLPAHAYLAPSDLSIYESQKNASITALRQGAEGWKIDKYKFLPEVEYAVQSNQAAEWYVFIESDTYVFWDNMFRLLENYDALMPWYFGSPSPGRTYEEEDSKEVKKVWFAYGGAGFVLSSPAAHRLVDRKRNALGIKGPRVTEEYKEDVRGDCCGDSILGWALHDKAGVDISGLWPMFNPHPLHEVPFGKKYWCEPVLTLHKSHAEDLIALWQWENRRDRSEGPLLYRDLLTYHPFFTWNSSFRSNSSFPLHIVQNWDNAYLDTFSEESPDHPANRALDACATYCHEHDKCWQFTWHAHHCWMSAGLWLGQKKEPDGQHSKEEREYVSGWDVEKIRRLWEERSCNEGVHWVLPSTERIF